MLIKTLPFILGMLFYTPMLRSVEPSLLEDVNKCDAIFCPSDSAPSRSGRSSPHPEASTNTGLKVQKLQATSMHIDPVILPTATKVLESHVPTETVLQNDMITPPSLQSPTTAPQDVKISARQKAQAPEFNSSNAGFRRGGPISGLQSASAPKPNLRHGYLYQNDHNDSGSADQKRKLHVQQNNFTKPNTNTEIKKATNDIKNAKENNDQEGVRANQALFSGSSSTPSSQFGQFESPDRKQHNNSQYEVDGGSKLLKQIAGALGLERFFATKGRRSGNSNLNQRKSGRKGNQGPRTKEKPLKDPRTILQAQLDKHLKQKRSMASGLEFGSSQSSLFQSMCEHYKRYAQRARIPYSNTQPCPKP